MAEVAFERLEHAGGAASTHVQGDLTSGALSCTLQAPYANLPTGATGKFYVVLDPTGTAEKVLCSTRAGATLNFDQRGADGTAAAAHTGSVVVKHVHSAKEADEANRAANKTIGQVSAAGDLLVADNANSLARLAKAGVTGRFLVSDEAQALKAKWSKIPTGAIDDPTMFAAGAVDSAALLDGTIVAGDIAAAHKDGAAGTVSLRTLGTGAAQAFPGTGRLDQLAVPTGAVALNAQKITGLANGSAASDAAAFGQIPAALPPNGAAGGDLTGTYPNPTIGAGKVTDAKVASGFHLVQVVADQPARVALSPGAGQLCVEQDYGHLLVWNGSAWVYLDTVPGAVMWDVGTTAPTGYLYSYGQTLTGGQTTYPGLWARLPAAFKSGADIVMPDFRGRTISALDNMGGSDAGRLGLANTIGTTGGFNTPRTTASTSEIESLPHTHQVPFVTTGGSTTATNTESAFHTHAYSSPGTGSDDNLQPTILLNGFVRV